MLDYLVLAAFLAGILNTIAGGTFLTFPALVYTGISPVAANATSVVAVFPGYLGGAAGFQRELKSFERGSLFKVIAVTGIATPANVVQRGVLGDRAFSASRGFDKMSCSAKVQQDACGSSLAGTLALIIPDVSSEGASEGQIGFTGLAARS